MKKALLYLFSFILLFGYPVSIKGQDTLAQAKKEMLSLKPLPYNKGTYNQFKKQKFYDYYQTRIKNKSFLDILFEKFNQWLSRSLNKTLDRSEFNTMLWIVGIVILIILGIIVYISKPGIFYINRKNPLSYSVEEENIENTDFDYLTEEAVKAGRFSDAIRRQYLKTLKVLQEHNCISYDSHKTVNEYVYEIKDSNLRKNFRNLSGEFVYYRYGKREADADKYAEFRAAAEIVQKMQTG